MSAKRRTYITTAIPYVNGDPHLGHALEFVQADVLARHRRLRGDDVRFLSGTDDNAFKNVAAAEAEGRPVAEFVGEKARRFADLARALQLSNDDFIRTSTDARHRPGVVALWRACAAAGDLYRGEYEGRYCSGCEAFLADEDLLGGECREHGDAPEPIAEVNWFFRLSRYEDAINSLIESGRVRVEPEQRRNEVLAFVRRGLTDFSVSRPRERARGWGIPVPNDPSQVIYVWFDALGNYITALDYACSGDALRRWWHESRARVHVIGKGIIRFHAVYWPAILISAREPQPTAILVHDYLTLNGQKLSKSAGNAIDPIGLVEKYGADAVRWWVVRDFPLGRDADFREESLAARANELADDLGNLINRTIALVNRYPPDGISAVEQHAQDEDGQRALACGLAARIDEALAVSDLRAAAAAFWDVVAEANRFVSKTRPWELAKVELRGDTRAGQRLDAVLGVLVDACSAITRELQPLLPGAAHRMRAALDEWDVEQGRTLFPKFAAD